MKRTWRNWIYSAWDLAWILRDKHISTVISRISLWFQGASVGRGLKTTGSCYFKLRKEGSITLADHVTLLAGWRSNLVGISNPVRIETLGNGTICIGNNTGGSGVVISSRSAIKIGDHVCMGANVRIADHDFHPLDPLKRRLARRESDKSVSTEPIKIGNDVFIGTNSIILKGVCIGERTIVAAGSVIFRGKYPSDCIFAGNPAKIVKF